MGGFGVVARSLFGATFTLLRAHRRASFLASTSSRHAFLSSAANSSCRRATPAFSRPDCKDSSAASGGFLFNRVRPCLRVRIPAVCCRSRTEAPATRKGSPARSCFTRVSSRMVSSAAMGVFELRRAAELAGYCARGARRANEPAAVPVTGAAPRLRYGEIPLGNAAGSRRRLVASSFHCRSF